MMYARNKYSSILLDVKIWDVRLYVFCHVAFMQRWTVTKYIYLRTVVKYTFFMCTLLEYYFFWKIATSTSLHLKDKYHTFTLQHLAYIKVPK